MEVKNREQMKAAILHRISEELDLWLEKEPAITKSYEYETELIGTCNRINKIVLEGSLAEQPRGRNAKKKS